MCKCTPEIKTPFCGALGCEIPKQNFRPTPKRLIIGPVKLIGDGMIFDSEGNHITDVRGWGRYQYMENSAAVHDKIAEWIVDAINKKLNENPI